MSVHSSLSNFSHIEIPNLPGVRRSAASSNPKLYKEFQKSKSQGSGVSLRDSFNFNGIDDEMSIGESFMESSKKLEEFSRSVSAFPNQGAAYNDISGRYSLRSQQVDRLQKSRSLPYCSLENAPAFVSNSKRTFSFQGYFDEYTPENLLETMRSRKVEIVYYEEDDSIEIVEPRVRNTGLSQGKMLKRHKVMKNARKTQLAPISEDVVPEIPYITLTDFYSGAEVVIYNRKYTIINCDNITREYFENELGSSFGPPLEMPETFYQPKSRGGVSTAGSGAPSLTPHKKVKSSLPFFEYDKKTLRYYALWDNREELFGDKIMVRLHYSLSDQLFEVVPIHQRNSGRDRIPKSLKKTQIMKTVYEGADDDNMSTTSSLTGAVSRQSLMSTGQGAAVVTRPWHWKDITIGTRLTIASMDVVIVDADEFTREFHKSKNRPIGKALAVVPEIHPVIEKMIQTRIEPEEVDIWALPSKDNFLPTQPPKDGAKMKMLQGVVLRFLAILQDPKPADVTRKFIIQVHLEDDTIQIREPPQRNSGHNGGIFLARGKIDNTDTGRYMFPQDIHVGGVISILSHKFIVVDSDEYTLKYMENTCKLWAYSDLKQVIMKIKEKEEAVQRTIVTTQNLANRTCTYDEVDSLFKLAGLALVKQELLTLCRELDQKKTGFVKLTQVLKCVMDMKA